MSRNEEKINITPEELNGVSGGFVEDRDVASYGWNVMCPYCANSGPDIEIYDAFSTGTDTVYICSHVENYQHIFSVNKTTGIIQKKEKRYLGIAGGQAGTQGRH